MKPHKIVKRYSKKQRYKRHQIIADKFIRGIFNYNLPTSLIEKLDSKWKDMCDSFLDDIEVNPSRTTIIVSESIDVLNKLNFKLNEK